MPAWITITLADLNDARVAELIEAVRTEELASGQGDPMPRRIATVTAEVRRCIAFCTSTPLDADTTTIPAGLKDMAVEKIFRGLKGRLLMPLTEDEVRAEALYQKRLEMLTRCEWPVDLPDTAATTPTVQPTTGAEQIGGAKRRFTADTLRDL